jgi:hypothetical protein
MVGFMLLMPKSHDSCIKQIHKVNWMSKYLLEIRDEKQRYLNCSVWYCSCHGWIHVASTSAQVK